MAQLETGRSGEAAEKRGAGGLRSGGLKPARGGAGRSCGPGGDGLWRQALPLGAPRAALQRQLTGRARKVVALLEGKTGSRGKGRQPPSPAVAQARLTRSRLRKGN